MADYLFILPLLSSLLSAFVGSLALRRGHGHPANLSFAAGLFAVGLSALGDAGVMLFSDRLAAEASLRVSIIGQSFLPVAWLAFSAVFARADYRDCIYSWGPLFLAAFLISFWFVLQSGSSGFIRLYPGDGFGELFADNMPVVQFGSTGKLFHIYTILMLVAALARLENTLRAASLPKRREIKFIVIGAGCILGLFIYTSSQALLFGSTDAQTLPLEAAVVLVAVSVITAHILRHGLFEVNIIISRKAVYSSLTFAFAGAYLLSVGTLTQALRRIAPSGYLLVSLFVFASILAFFLIVFSETIRRKTELFISTHFYRSKHEFKTIWMDTIERLGCKMAVAEVSEAFVELLSAALGSKAVHLWVRDAQSQGYSALCAGAGRYSKIGENDPLIQHISRAKAPFMLDKTQAGPPAETSNAACLEELRAAFDASVCSPLATNDEMVGFALLAPDITGTPYTHEDIEILKAISSHAAVQIKNARLTAEVMEAKEADVFHRMSSFIMHDLKNFTNSLSLVSQNARFNMNNPDFQKDSIKTVEQIVPKMKNLIEKLGSVPREIALKRKKTDIRFIINCAIERLGLKNGPATCVEKADAFMPPAYIDPEAMETVIVNLLANARDAAGDYGRITITTAQCGETIRVSIKDTGAGMPKEFIATCLFKPFKTTKKNGFGIGLYQCKSIVEAHGGRIDVESSVGIGTEFTIRLPLPKTATVAV